LDQGCAETWAWRLLLGGREAWRSWGFGGECEGSKRVEFRWKKEIIYGYKVNTVAEVQARAASGSFSRRQCLDRGYKDIRLKMTLVVCRTHEGGYDHHSLPPQDLALRDHLPNEYLLNQIPTV
jgi:hypothetical protein